MSARHALVVGAGGAVGESIANGLRTLGWRVTGALRQSRPDVEQRLARAGVDLVRFDLERDDLAPLAADAEAVVLTPILALAVRAAPALRRAKRVVAFSSNNVAIDLNAASYRRLAEAERALRAEAPHAIILRPTLIYGDPRLPTVPRIVRLARRWPVLPVPGSGRAPQQPVFHADLGAAAAALAAGDAHAGATFALGGPDILSMRDFFRAIARAAGVAPPILPTPRWMLAAGSALLGARFPFSAEQIARVEESRCAAPQTPVPPEIAPRTSLQTGLAALVAAMKG